MSVEVTVLPMARNVSGMMCSYNSVNGVPSCANDWLLKTVARESWKFDGYITRWRHA
jgi:beta-glucosidase-like glycosyl hydrolase